MQKISRRSAPRAWLTSFQVVALSFAWLVDISICILQKEEEEEARGGGGEGVEAERGRSSKLLTLKTLAHFVISFAAICVNVP